jgi:hypothetical protein
MFVNQRAPLIAPIDLSWKTTPDHISSGAIIVMVVVSGVFRRRFRENGVKFTKTPLHRYQRFDSKHAPLRLFPSQFRHQKQNAVSSGANFALKMRDFQ